MHFTLLFALLLAVWPQGAAAVGKDCHEMSQEAVLPAGDAAPDCCGDACDCARIGSCLGKIVLPVDVEISIALCVQSLPTTTVAVPLHARLYLPEHPPRS